MSSPGFQTVYADTADAVSAYTQVKMEDAPDCSEFQDQNVLMYGYVCHAISG